MSIKSSTLIVALLCNLSTQPLHAATPVFSLEWPQTTISADKIEASGVLWDAKGQHFLIASDETYKKQPGIFVLERDGNLRGLLNMLPGTAIDELESISTDGDYIYILNSFNVKDPSKAQELGTGKLLRFKYQDDKVTEQQEINLRSLLVQALSTQANSRLALLLKDPLDKQTINIEAHIIVGNDLYVAFKAPLENARESIFVKFSNIAGMFQGQVPDVQIVLTLSLIPPGTNEITTPSDMILVDGDLLLLSTEKGKSPNSYLWRYSLSTQKLSLLNTFSQLQAEGITYYADSQIVAVVFDEGSNKVSKYQLFSLSELK